MSLYDELGVDPNATEAQIRQAHRKKVKATHPDAGGDRDAFERVQRAYLVLSDPGRRDRYDSTGAEDDPMGADEAQALAILSHKLAAMVENPQFDPRRVDILAHIKVELMDEKAQAQTEISKSKTQVIRIEEFGNRLKAKKDTANRLSKVMEALATDQRRRIDSLETAVRVYTIALALAEHYVYATDAAEPHVAGHPVLTESVLRQMFYEANPGGRGSIFGGI